MAQQAVNQVATPSDPFILLLQGLYQPVPAGKGPKNNLGLVHGKPERWYVLENEDLPRFRNSGKRGPGRGYRQVLRVAHHEQVCLRPPRWRACDAVPARSGGCTPGV